MDCFIEPLTIIYIRDVSQTYRSLILKRKNLRGKNQLERIRISTETLSHEIRAPLANIVMLIDVLIAMLARPLEIKSMKRYYKQVRHQATLLLNIVQD